jgi:hypothetical protein
MPIDRSYATLNNHRNGGSEWDVGGKLNVNSGGVLAVESGGVASLAAGSYLLEVPAEGLTAHSGGGQALATAIPALLNRFTTVATAADSAVLPASQGITGASITVINAGAASMQVYGSGTDTINGVAYGTGVALPAGKTASFFTTVAGAWHMQLSA